MNKGDLVEKVARAIYDATKWSVMSGQPKHLVCLTSRNSRRNMSETSVFVANHKTGRKAASTAPGPAHEGMTSHG